MTHTQNICQRSSWPAKPPASKQHSHQMHARRCQNTRTQGGSIKKSTVCETGRPRILVGQHHSTTALAPQHQHHSTSKDHSHTTVSNHRKHSSSSPCSWADHQGWIHLTKPKPIAKANQHGYISKTRGSKEQAKHQGGAGQARKGAKHKEVQGKPPGRSRASTRINWSSLSKNITNITTSHS
jgi:hypothetical protein